MSCWFLIVLGASEAPYRIHGRIILQVWPSKQLTGITLTVLYMQVQDPDLTSRIRTSDGEGVRILYFNKLFRWLLCMFALENRREQLPVSSHPPVVKSCGVNFLLPSDCSA